MVAIENLSPGKRVLPDDLDKLDFDGWKELYERDPKQFDRYRKRILNQQIAMAPESSRPRLLGLLFQMEAEALRSPTPISYSLRLSAIMMDKFEQLRQHLNMLSASPETIDTALQPIHKSAEIIPLDQYRLPER